MKIVLFRCTLVVVLAASLACSSSSKDDGGEDLVGDIQDSDIAVVPDSQLSDLLDTPDVVASFPEILASHIEAAMAEYLAFSGDPGVSVAIRLADASTFVEVAGVSDMVTKEPMTTRTAFRVGSNTKPYISALIMMLVDEGLVALDDPVSLYLTDYPKWDDITIRQLLGMKSGIVDYLLSESFMMAAVFAPSTLTTPQVLLDFVKDADLMFEPGSECYYTNTNYIIVGLIIEEVTGQPAHEALKSRLLDPLGLVDTYLDVVDEPKENLSHGYLDLAIVGFFFGLGADAVALLPQTWFMQDYLVDATYLFPPMFAWTDGGLVTTPGDAMAFMHALLTGEIISASSLAEMQVTDLCPILGTPADYGLGLSTATGFFGTRWGHGGLNFGYEANTIFFPEKDITFSHMHNYLPEQSYRLEDEVLALMDRELTELPDPVCEVPEGLFGGKGGEVVEFRFKGPIEPEGATSPAPGIAHVRGTMNEENLALYGYGTHAVEHSAGEGRRIDVISMAPALTDGVDLRVAVISIDATALADAGGEVVLGSPADLVVLVTETALAPETQEVAKTCVVAVSDLTLPATLHACGGDGYAALAGDPLKVFGVAPVTQDVAAIEAIVATVPMDRCSCMGDSGEMEPCE